MSMQRKLTACLAAAWLALGAMPALAQPTAAEEAERAENARRLEEAQRKLEEAAREVAELSADMVGPVMRDLRRIRLGGPRRAVIGVNLGAAEPGVQGARVVSVSPGGPAAEAGVQAGDLIVAIDGDPIGSGRDLAGRMREVEPGKKVSLGLKRGNRDLQVVLVARPAEDLMWLGEAGDMPMPPFHRGHFLLGPWADTEFVPMTPGLGRYFGTDKGLLVVRSPKSGAAGLEDGDVILSIGGREPTSSGHALRILGSYEAGETVEVTVLRQKQRQTLKVTVPEASFRAVPVPPAPPAPRVAPAPRTSPAPPAPPAG